MSKSYSELMTLKTFKERFNYLKETAKLGEETFGVDRYLNQKFYVSAEWKEVRRRIIIRDNGCDLGCEGYDIVGQKILVHHINRITPNDLMYRTEKLIDPENLITVSYDTHELLHYGNSVNSSMYHDYAERLPGDTNLW